ncbi:glycosyl hydrolase family 18 protein [Shewanella submarina]|uniref:Glycosyl hydrolase family 18 protein n=1 Tax=Shewanella submarina TaxID=2016376 RepID=A0ABV7G8H6_9GAMM|nr:glycosyl hydrolase family 18 protein [Shewanella submarina]MCL1036818.1 glycosyl hydrolase family 18 protein [Shewanella submarina]
MTLKTLPPLILALGLFGCGSDNNDDPAQLPAPQPQAFPQAEAGFFLNQGESCPESSIHVNISEALANRSDICDEMGDWDITRLGENAAIFGNGYGCKVEQNQPQQLANSACKTVYKVDSQACPFYTEHVTLAEANDNSKGDADNLCNMLNRDDEVQLAANASMSRPTGFCKTTGQSSGELNASLCKNKLDAVDADSGIDSSQRKVAYVEVNNNDFGNVGCFEQNGEALFDIAVIFAANINYDSSEQKAVLHLNDQVTDLLENNIETVRAVQAKGTKVVLDILGNHQNAGWACFADEDSARDFAGQLKDAVDKYGLDGIDIDDEYSKCDNTYEESVPMVVKAIRDAMPDKLLTKALFADFKDFQADWNGHKLRDQLDFGWDMRYWSGNCEARLSAYRTLGMSDTKLGVGASTIITSSARAKNLAQCLDDNNLEGGMMIFNLTKDSYGYLQSVWQGVEQVPNCLK